MGSKEFFRIDVPCPGCGDAYHETTPLFDKTVPTDGTMLRLKEPYRSWGWTSFPEVPDASWGWLECPHCGHPYVTESSGVVKLSRRISNLRAKPITVLIQETQELVTAREIVVAEMMKEKASPKDIAKEIGISKARTVTIMKKVSSSLEA